MNPPPAAPTPCRLLLALAPEEIADFLPPPLEGECLALFPGAADHCAPVGDAARWADQLRRFDPETLVTCWQTPRLPDDLPPRLRYVCHLGGSTRGLVSRRHLEGGLLVTNWGGSVSRSVAEGALALMLAALHRLQVWGLRLHSARGWKQAGDRVESLLGRRVGFHGFGLVARELAGLLALFGTRIVAHAPGVDDNVLATHRVVRAVSLDALFAENEIVVELAPLTAETRGLVTERHLRLIPTGGLFVNVARGAIVDEVGLLRVAREGRIQLALDVFQEEPLPANSALRGLANVTLTPHVAGPSDDRRRDAGAFALKNLRAYRDGQPLDAVVTPGIHDRAT